MCLLGSKVCAFAQSSCNYAVANFACPIVWIIRRGRYYITLYGRQTNIFCFWQLKSLVPEIANEDKVSKLMILTKAAKYCRSLATHDARVTDERHKNVALRKKLLSLQNLPNLYNEQKKNNCVHQKWCRKRSLSQRANYHWKQPQSLLQLQSPSEYRTNPGFWMLNG